MTLTRSCRWSIYRPPYFQLSETHKNKKVNLLGFSLLPDDHYNLNLSSGKKVNPQSCFIYFYETCKVEKVVVDLQTSWHKRVNILRLTQVRFTIQNFRFNIQCSRYFLKAGLLVYTENFKQFTWELYEKKLDVRYFYFGRYFIHFLLIQ